MYLPAAAAGSSRRASDPAGDATPPDYSLLPRRPWLDGANGEVPSKSDHSRACSPSDASAKGLGEPRPRRAARCPASTRPPPLEVPRGKRGRDVAESSCAASRDLAHVGGPPGRRLPATRGRSYLQSVGISTFFISDLRAALHRSRPLFGPLWGASPVLVLRSAWKGRRRRVRLAGGIYVVDGRSYFLENFGTE